MQGKRSAALEITETRVKLADSHQERLLAFCTITFDDAFVIRDVKVIEGPRGPFVAMPSRKVMGRCGDCGEKNHLRANYCNQCGKRTHAQRTPDDSRARTRLYVDIAHPINQESRKRIERAALAAFEKEVGRSNEPGYQAPDLDDFAPSGDNHHGRHGGKSPNGKSSGSEAKRGGSGKPDQRDNGRSRELSAE